MFRFLRSRPAAALVIGAMLATAGRTSAQTTYTWNSTGTDWSTAGDWSPAGPPTAADFAWFTPDGASAGTAVMNPGVSATVVANSLTIAPSQILSGWTFSGTGTITLGGTSSTGLTTYGPATYTFNGPALQGANTTNTLALTVNSGSTLTLQGNSVANTNIAATTTIGGMLILDNGTTNLGNRLGTTSALLLHSGTLEMLGNATASASFSLGPISTSADGVNTIEIAPAGQAVTATFNNTGSFTFPSNGFRFVATSGVLGGGGTNPTITFAGAPTVATNGLLADAATVTDASGTDFATWIVAAGVKAAGATVTTATVAGLQGAGTTDRVYYTPATGNQNITGNINVASLRITPAAAGATLTVNSNFNINTNNFMLNGPIDFTITGPTFRGLAAAMTTMNIFVNNPSTTLNLGDLIAGANNVRFDGPGFVVLTGTGSQDGAVGGNEVGINGGTLRANNTQLGFNGSGEGNIVFRGGVLEIQNGSNGTGSSADFTRPLGGTLVSDSVRWDGGGGFSAFGANASVDIGPFASLQWNATNFVSDGYPLIFGSTKSNAVLTFQNSIQLSNGTGYQLREIQVIGGAGGDKTVMSGIIMGAAGTDLIKTGTGALELTANNIYAGNTFVQAGTLRAMGQTGTNSGTGTGSVFVNAGATLGGTGRIAGAVTLNAGSTIFPGNSSGVGTLTLNSGLTVMGAGIISTAISASGSPALAGTGGSNLGTVPNPTNVNFLNLTGGALTFDSTAINLTVNGAAVTFMAGQSYSYQIAQVAGQNFSTLVIVNPAQFTNVGFTPAVESVTGNVAGAVFLNFTPVPEPGLVLTAAALAFGGMRLRFRPDKRTTETQRTQS